MKTVWIVHVSYEDEDPVDYGQYTQRQARKVEHQLVKEIHKYNIDGVCKHPYNVINACALPLLRYDDFVNVDNEPEE